MWRYTVSSRGLSKATLVREEKDPAMGLSVQRTRDGAYLLIEGASDMTNYVLGLDAVRPSGAAADLLIAGPHLKGLKLDPWSPEASPISPRRVASLGSLGAWGITKL